MQPTTLVIYRSKTGFTKKYAEQLAKALGCPCKDFQSVTSETLCAYDTVIFGSRVHAGRIDSFQKAKALFQKSTASRFVLFVTGATPGTAESVIDAFWKQNLSEEELQHLPHFYLPSGLCYEKMSLLDRLMMKLAASAMKQQKDADGQEAAQSITHSYDISSEAYLAPLLAFLRAQ